MASSTCAIAQMLFNCIIEAEDISVKDLAETLAEYKETYRHTHSKLLRHPFSAAMLGAMEEAVQYHNEVNGGK